MFYFHYCNAYHAVAIKLIETYDIVNDTWPCAWVVDAIIECKRIYRKWSQINFIPMISHRIFEARQITIINWSNLENLDNIINHMALINFIVDRDLRL